MASRRQFLRNLGGGILIVFSPEAAHAQRRGGESLPREIAGWLHIGEDGAITVYTGKAEMGQNIRTSLTQVVAEELRAPLEAIRLVMGDTDLTPFDGGTSGSRTTPIMSPQLRKVAATARELLLDLAVEKWKVDRGPLVVAGGKITDPRTRQSLGFGELTRGQKLVETISDNAPLTPPQEWKTAGHSVPKVNGREFVTGAHKYTTDLKLPGMLHGKVLRPSVFQAKLVSLDAQKAEAMPGVTVVRDGPLRGVTAPSAEAASRALAAIVAEWKAEPQPSEAELFEHLKKHAAPGSGGGTRGSIEKGLAEADRKLQASYTVAYIAHAPLEPRAAVAEWTGGKLTVWTSSQRPFGVRGELAAALGISENRVRVIVPDSGSGYGGKHFGDAAIEAARLARAAGKPVKVVWTREEEFTWAYFRPAGAIEVASGVRSDGTLTAWEFHNYNSGGAGIQHVYDVPNQRIEFHSSRPPLRQGSYRALAATANHFARESHLDEVARALALDPVELRLKNLKDARMRAVVEAAAARFGWPRKSAPGHGAGFAAGFEKGSYVATCAEVRTEGGRVRILRVVEAFECGAVVNPDHLKNQVEGMIIMAIGGALFEAIHFDNGRILNPRFSRYRVPRFSDVPLIETVLVDRKDLPSAGGGETPIVGLAPAVANAIFDAARIRLRSLPLAPQGLQT